MRTLIIKTSSIGDIVHTFPALTDAMKAYPSLVFDWVVEEKFASIPRLHPAVKHVIPVKWQEWRSKLWNVKTWKEIQATFSTPFQESYDFIIDAQGLLKSGLLTHFTKGKKYGYGWGSARESLASLFYEFRLDIPKDQSAIERTRMLFSQAMNYPFPQTPPHANLALREKGQQKNILFLPGASRFNKRWPIPYWKELAIFLQEEDQTIDVPWSTQEEYEDALYIQTAGSFVRVLDKMSLGQMAEKIPTYSLVISGDSGLGHLAAAFQVPTLILWGSTSPKVMGQMPSQHNLVASIQCSPCLKRECRNEHLSILQPPCLSRINSIQVSNYIEEHFRKNPPT